MKKQSLILAVILVLGSVLSSCGSETTSQTGTTTAADGATATEETDLRFVADELPDLDFGGKTMNVVVGDYFGAYWDDLYAEEATGSRLSDAIYNMRLAVEHRLNVKLNYIREEYNWDSMGDYITKITSQILAGDGDIDLLLSQNNFTSRLGEGQYFADLRNVDHIDLEKPWYNQSVLGNMPDGELPFVLGEFSLGNIKNAYVVYYNSNLKGSLGIDTDLYALVDEGKWTADAMQSLIKDTYSDLNGDTTAAQLAVDAGVQAEHRRDDLRVRDAREDHHRDRDKGYQRETNVYREHHYRDAYDKQKVRDHVRHRVSDKNLKLSCVVQNAAHEFSGLFVLVVAHRELFELVVDLERQLGDELPRGNVRDSELYPAAYRPYEISRDERSGVDEKRLFCERPDILYRRREAPQQRGGDEVQHRRADYAEHGKEHRADMVRREGQYSFYEFHGDSAFLPFWKLHLL